MAADGYLVISAYVPKHWTKLCEIIDRPDMLEDERFADQRARALNYHELTEELEKALAARTAAEWVALLQQGGLMACLPHTWKQVVGTPLFAENELALQVGDSSDSGGAVTVVRMPARYSSFDAVVTDPPPAPGQHNAQYLT
jgi:crotonobetainyl-CoA:carnitine CoA-transferase CaiB-like acyl-CoA transferase